MRNHVRIDPYDLIDKLDFGKIRKYMKKTNWTWFSPTGEHVPTVGELRDTATELLQSVVNSTDANTQCSTGGFMACKFTFDHTDHPCYDIMFCLEHRSNY